MFEPTDTTLFIYFWGDEMSEALGINMDRY